MTPNEAIKRLQLRLDGYPPEDASENMDDVELGKEALKRLLYCRFEGYIDPMVLLPGETEERRENERDKYSGN